MGVDTHGLIRGKIDSEKIIDYIRKNIDKNVRADITTKSYGSISENDFLKEFYDDSGEYLTTSGFISFKSKKGNNRNLFYVYNNANSFENLDYYKKRYDYLEEMVKSETTYLNLGCDDEAIEIITDIVIHFGGGWVEENDCDGREYYPIELGSDGFPIPVCFVKDGEDYSYIDRGIVIVEHEDYSKLVRI